MTKYLQKFTTEKKFDIFLSKIAIYVFLGLRKSKLQEKKPSALRREYTALQNMKFLNIFYFCGLFLPS
jgi:hypothetical protein